MQKYILLDIDGVMVPASGWKPVELHSDGFYQFNSIAQKNLDWILERTGATIILTTTHRNKYTSLEWKKVFSRRFKFVNKIKTIDDFYSKVYRNNTPKLNKLTIVSFNLKLNGSNVRLKDVIHWVEVFGDSRYVIIDDDTSLNLLPSNMKKHWVKTSPMIGLNEEAAEKALKILTTA